MEEGGCQFAWAKHRRYFRAHLQVLPEPYKAMDTSRMTLAYFAIAGLDLCGGGEGPEALAQAAAGAGPGPGSAADDDAAEKGAQWRAMAVRWVYSMLLADGSGFRGSDFLGAPPPPPPVDRAHVTMTYTALATLLILGDDLAGVHPAAVAAELRALQRPDGSFVAMRRGDESDVRFVYCACAVSYMLRDWSGVDRARAVAYLRSCRAFDGSFGQEPRSEGQAGSTYCALAALHLLGALDEVVDADWRAALLQWLVSRQVSGFQGRCNKLPDTCYSFWVGASLRILGADHLINAPLSRSFTLRCEYQHGGFSKNEESPPDLPHSYMSIAGIVLTGGDGPLVPPGNLFAPLGFSERAHRFWQSLRTI
jgi:geranylgeranyl transferase type-1 subunit beta